MYKNDLFWVNVFLFLGLSLSLLILIIGSSISSLLCFIILAIFGIVIGLKLGRIETKLFIIVYYCNIFIILVLYLIYMSRYGIPYYCGGSDDLHYEEYAQKVVQSLGIFDYFSIRGNVVSYFHNSVGYLYLVSLLYRFGNIFDGFHTLLPRFLNSFTLSILAILVFCFSYNKLNLKLNTSIVIGLITGLAPILMYISAHTFRDVIVAVLIFLCMYLWNNYSNYNCLQRLFLLFITPLLIFILWEFRNFGAIVALFLILVSYFNSEVNFLKYNKIKKILKLFFIVIVTGTLLYYLYSIGKANWFIDRSKYYYSFYTEYRLDKSPGLAKYVFSSSGFLGLFLRLIYLSVTPFPIFSMEIERCWLSIGTIFQFFLLPFLIIGLIRLFIEKKELQIPIGFIMLFTGVALFSFQSRHIILYYPFAVIAGGYGYDYYRSKGFEVKNVWLLMYFMFIIGMMAYISIKMGV